MFFYTVDSCSCKWCSFLYTCSTVNLFHCYASALLWGIWVLCYVQLVWATRYLFMVQWRGVSDLKCTEKYEGNHHNFIHFFHSMISNTNISWNLFVWPIVIYNVNHRTAWCIVRDEDLVKNHQKLRYHHGYAWSTPLLMTLQEPSQ